MKYFVRYGVAAVLLTVAAGMTFAQEQSAQARQRGFFFEGEIGPAYTSYDPAMDALFSQAQALGASRVRVMLSLALGYSVSKNLYVVGGVVGYGDRFYDSYNFVQLNTYFWNLGVRYYPFTTGLVLGFDAGLANMAVTSDVGLSGSSASPGFGLGILIAYDFARNPTGFSFEAEIRADYANIAGSPMSGVALVLALLWK